MNFEIGDLVKVRNEAGNEQLINQLQRAHLDKNFLGRIFRIQNIEYNPKTTSSFPIVAYCQLGIYYPVDVLEPAEEGDLAKGIDFGSVKN